MRDDTLELPPRPELPQYKGCKVVRAIEIADIYEDESGKWQIVPADAEIDTIEVGRGFIDIYNPKIGGYYVLYEDSYESYLPKAVFEAGYSPICDILCPMFNKVIVQPDEAKEERSGKIILPPKVKEGEIGQYGTVLAVGPGKWNESSPEPRRVPMSVKFGDRVMFNRHAGVDEKLDGRKIKTIYETDIWRVVG